MGNQVNDDTIHRIRIQDEFLEFIRGLEFRAFEFLFENHEIRKKTFHPKPLKMRTELLDFSRPHFPRPIHVHSPPNPNDQLSPIKPKGRPPVI
ncbi:unnamed protein product [Dovyalis caffra]|uniref:Maturase K n=1 Tax=Dovyalis caffra TaxID=77055 RepID=A0AAV1SUV6_9ROSI|nr:unnamed protein product [Dovyalis caffra]